MARSGAGQAAAAGLLLCTLLLTSPSTAAAFPFGREEALPPCSQRLTEAARRVLAAYRREVERNRQRDVLPEDLQTTMTRFVDWLNGLGVGFKVEQRRRELIDNVARHRRCVLKLP